MLLFVRITHVLWYLWTQNDHDWYPVRFVVQPTAGEQHKRAESSGQPAAHCGRCHLQQQSNGHFVLSQHLG